ncbi:MAG: glycosyl hydrolase [Spirochaetes bacterium]|nr:glycosyl hydrolase [Spirochaetota bacterium]
MSDANRFSDEKRVRDARPWTRWWWLGSCVTEPEITRQLGLLRDTGFGGVEIQPIYAPDDPPVAPIPYLSPAWLRMLEYTLREAGRLGLGVDLTMGSGWPWGGPWVSPDLTARRLVVERKAGKSVARSVPTGKWVKRAGPGGEGPVVDPYSVEAMRTFLAGFEAPLASLGPLRPAAAFTDSFEVFEADHTPGLATAFLERRGYDPGPWLDRLDGDDDLGRRLRHDYRWTMAELLEDSYRLWVDWCHANGMTARLQAHGSPGPLVDYYALSDVPETESFSRSGLAVPVAKMASSAAHLAARPVCSAEAFTWLGEHFTVGLDAMRRAADGFFLAGVNRLFFQGVAYSPAGVPWPGWLFYASTNSGENAGWFEHLGCLTAYLARCQEAMSRGGWDPDVLLYFPQHDVYAGETGEFERIHGTRLRLCTVSNAGDWFERGTPGTWRAAQDLRDAGVQYDIVTDRVVRERLSACDGRIRCGRDGLSYAALIFAGCGLVERETLEAAQRLAREGAAVWFVGGMPRSMPTGPDPRAGFDGAAIGGAARVLPADADLASELDSARVRRERLDGFEFVRRLDAGATVYFLRRGTDSGFHGWLRLSAAGGTARVTDPVTGLVEAVPARTEDGGTAVLLEVEPGGSRIVEVGGSLGAAPVRASPHAARAIAVPGPWALSWTGADGEVHRTSTDLLASWPELPGIGLAPAAVEYETAFDIGSAPAGVDWLLDLGELRGSASASLNGVPIGTAWTAPYRLRVPRGILSARNTLRLRVLVVEANRIIDLERRNVPWRKFFFVNRDYGRFDTSSWTPLPVGLLGPVILKSF